MRVTRDGRAVTNQLSPLMCTKPPSLSRSILMRASVVAEFFVAISEVSSGAVPIDISERTLCFLSKCTARWLHPHRALTWYPQTLRVWKGIAKVGHFGALSNTTLDLWDFCGALRAAWVQPLLSTTATLDALRASTDTVLLSRRKCILCTVIKKGEKEGRYSHEIFQGFRICFVFPLSISNFTVLI